MSTKINRRKVSEFQDDMTSNLRSVFGNLEGQCKISLTPTHDAYPKRIDDKWFLGKFYNLFIRKVILNIQDKDMSNDIIDNYASIFPFIVDASLSYDEPEILAQFDFFFHEEITSFLDDHFDSFDCEKNIKIFLTNIHKHKEENKPAKSTNSENNLVEKLSALSNDSETSQSTGDVSRLPKLNYKGIQRFKNIQDMVKDTIRVYEPERLKEIAFEKYDDAYFGNLSESNFEDLHSLLDLQFYTSERDEYVARFKKYLFFFVHATRTPRNPVFFIDDLLYECLKSVHTFKKSRRDAVQLKSHIALLVCVFMRKFNSVGITIHDADTSHLQSVARCIQAIPGIRTGILDYKTAGVYPENWIFFCTHDEAMEVYFSGTIKEKILHFTNLITSAALSPMPIKTLSIYNVYLGHKTFMTMPTNIDGIVNFVKKYNAYDSAQKAKPEYFLQEDFDECFMPVNQAKEVKQKSSQMQ